MELRFWAATDVGRVRDHNEDNFLVDKKLQLFVVCDGMGGHAAGEVASAICVRTVRDVVATEAETLARLRENPADPMGRQIIEGLLGRAIRTASARIFEMAQKDASRRGMGTTCIALVMVGDRGFVGHVGDSRLYRVRNQEVEQVSIDHSLLNEMIRQGKIPATTTEAEFPHNNAVTRAVGVREAVEVETFQFEVQPGDRLMMCSDGLSEYFRGGVDLVQLLGEAEPKETTARCIEHANRSGGKDNITVVVVDYGVEEDEEVRVENERVVELLRKTPYFHYLAPTELEHIRGLATRIEYEADEAVVDGESNRDQLFIILKGSVSLQLDGKQVSVLMTGEHFGEMALIDAQDEHDERMVVRTLEPTLLLGIARDKFMGLLRSAPPLAVKLLWNYVQVFADRLQAVPTRLRFTPDEWRSEAELVADETPPSGLLVFEDDLRRMEGGESAEDVGAASLSSDEVDEVEDGVNEESEDSEDSRADEDAGFPMIAEEVGALGNLSSLAETSEEDAAGWDSRKTMDLGQVDFSSLNVAPPRPGERAAEDDMDTPPPGPFLEDEMPPTGEFLFHPEKFDEVMSEVSESEDDELALNIPDEIAADENADDEETREIDPDRVNRLRAQLGKQEESAPSLEMESSGAKEVEAKHDEMDEASDPNETLKPWEGLRATMQMDEASDEPAVKAGQKVEVDEPEEDLAKTVDISADVDHLRSLRAKTSGALKDKLRERMKSRPAPTAEVLKKATSSRVTMPLDAAKRSEPRAVSNEPSEANVEATPSENSGDSVEKEGQGLAPLSGSSVAEDVKERARKAPAPKEPKVMISPDLMSDPDE